MNLEERGYGIKKGDRILYHHCGQKLKGIAQKFQRRTMYVRRADRNWELMDKGSVVSYKDIVSVNDQPFTMPEAKGSIA